MVEKCRNIFVFVFVLETLRKLLVAYHKRLCILEEEKYDLEYSVAKKDYEASTNSSHVMYLNVCLAALFALFENRVFLTNRMIVAVVVVFLVLHMYIV